MRCAGDLPLRFPAPELESGPQEEGQMKRARSTEEQIIGILREQEAGAKAADLARNPAPSAGGPLL